MKKPSNRFWALLLVGVVALSAVAIYFMTRPQKPIGNVAVIYIDGQEYDRIDLGAVDENYTFTIQGKSGLTNDIEVAPGKIRVSRADCPDQVCVGEGWIEEGFLPIACLPNTLIIQVIDNEDMADIDSMVG